MEMEKPIALSYAKNSVNNARVTVRQKQWE